LINEELSSKLMDQFIYECIGSKTNSKIISKVEQASAQDFLEEKVTKKVVQEASLFEPEVSQKSNVKQKSKLSKEQEERYSDFLED
jgi:hypothetical protein